MVYIGFNPREITAFDFIRDLESTPFRQVYAEEVKELLEHDYHSCCNLNHKDALGILKRRFGIDIDIPLKPLLHRLRRGDKVIIIIMAGVRRLTNEERYTEEELRKVRVYFRLYKIR